MHYSIYQFLFFFLIYAFLGWCVEVAFHVITTGKFINRGFLNGPVCPIYGVGMILIIWMLMPLRDSVLALFAGAIALTTALEFVTGFILEKVFHDKWWDYSKEPFNVMGYICLRFSLMWGIGCLLVVDFVQPLVEKGIAWLPHKLGLVLLCIGLAGIMVDSIVTVFTILKFNKRLHLIDEISQKLKDISEGVGENIFVGVTKGLEVKDEISEHLEDAKASVSDKRADVEELKAKYNELIHKKQFGHKRIIKAFPSLSSITHQDALNKNKFRCIIIQH